MSDIKDVLVPDLGEDAVEVIEICVAVGDKVDAEDSIITVESDKASMDIPAPFAGSIAEICVAVGDKISEGTLLAKISAASAAAPAAPALRQLSQHQRQSLKQLQLQWLQNQLQPHQLVSQ